jgi:hypothetical protein
MYICTKNSQYALFFISLKKHNSTAEITLSKITEMCQCDTNAPASRNFKTQKFKFDMSFIVDYNITKFQINKDSVEVWKLLNRYIDYCAVGWNLLLHNNNVNLYFTDQTKVGVSK